MVRWQDIAKWGSGGLIGILALVAGLVSLTGVDANHDGDKFCTDCYSMVNTSSTYWEVKVEHAGDKEIIFKKSATSRTLYVNLDRVQEFVPTEPSIKVEILVPATSSSATVKHPEYGYLRPLKDGDTLIGRGKDRFVLHATKPEDLTVKWSFNLESGLMEDINIDPVWYGLSVNYLYDCWNETRSVPVLTNVSVPCEGSNASCPNGIFTYPKYLYEDQTVEVCSSDYPAGLRVGNKRIDFGKKNVRCVYRFNDPFVSILCLNCNRGDCVALRDGKIQTRQDAKGQEGCLFRFNAQTRECTSQCNLDYFEGVGRCVELD